MQIEFILFCLYVHMLIFLPGILSFIGVESILSPELDTEESKGTWRIHCDPISGILCFSPWDSDRNPQTF